MPRGGGSDGTQWIEVFGLSVIIAMATKAGICDRSYLSMENTILKREKESVCVRVCACVRACTRACVRVCACVFGSVNSSCVKSLCVNVCSFCYWFFHVLTLFGKCVSVRRSQTRRCQQEQNDAALLQLTRAALCSVVCWVRVTLRKAGWSR